MASSAVDFSIHDRVASFTTHDTHVETASAWACMVVSQGKRLDMLLSAAENAGWDTIQLATSDAAGVQSAVAQVRANSPHLLIVDLAGSNSNGQCRGLVEKVAAIHGLLLLVCGNEGDPAEEIWARTLGVWLYLPGVADDADLSSLCIDALQIAERNARQTIELSGAAQRRKR